MLNNLDEDGTCENERQLNQESRSNLMRNSSLLKEKKRKFVIAETGK